MSTKIKISMSRYRLLVSLIAILSGFAFVRGYELKGVITSPDGHGVQGVRITFMPLKIYDAQQDSVQIAGCLLDSLAKEQKIYPDSTTEDNSREERAYTVFTDINGIYHFQNIAGGSYHMSITHSDYESVEGDLDITADFLSGGMVLTPNEIATVNQLEEIEVTARILENYHDRTELYLTKENRNYGINALDAISSLPLFRHQINGGALENLDGTKVNVLINGRRASEEEIRNLKGDDIQKVIYYDNAPAKYASFFGGPVANIILKKPKELMFAANIAAEVSNLLTAGGNAGVVINSPLHYVNGLFSINGSHITDRKSTELYDYGDLINSFNQQSGLEKSLKSYSSVTYQFEKANHMLHTNISYLSASDKVENYYGITESDHLNSIEGIRQTGRHSIGDQFIADVYYSYAFEGGQEISIDVLNSYNKTGRDTYNAQDVEDGSAYSSYLNSAHTNNTIYTLAVSAMFSSPLWGGSISGSICENYVNLHQQYKDNFFPDLPSSTHNRRHNPYIAIGYSRNFNKFGTSLSIGAFDTYTKLSEGGTHNQFTIYPRINLSYAFTPAHMLRFAYWVESSTNSLGAMNSNRYFIDSRYFSENNSYEHAVYSYCGSLGASLSIPEAKLYLSPSLTYRYIKKPYVDYVIQENQIFIRKTIVVPEEHNLTYSLGLTWNPFPGLSIQPFFRGQYITYTTPIQRVRFDWNTLNLNASYTVSNIQLYASCSTPGKSIDGVVETHTGWNVNASAYWKYRNLFIGIDYAYMQDANMTITEIPGFLHSTTAGLRDMTYQLSVKVGYTFQTGNSHKQHRQKRLNNSASESGFAN